MTEPALSDQGRTVLRAAWHTRVSGVVYTWLAMAGITFALGNRLDDGVWLGTHFLLLGAVTNALFIWSWHFTGAILRIPVTERTDELMRLVVLNLGVAGVIIGGFTEAPAIVTLSMLLCAAAVLLLARAIHTASKRALPSPYAFTATAYVYAAVLLVPGILLGAFMEDVDVTESMEARLMLAHVALNLLGWIGIPILGTIVTLWPTMLRTRIAPNAAKLARRVLPLLAAGAVVAALGFALGSGWLASVGFAMYVLGYLVTMGPIVSVIRTKPPTSFATLSALVGLTWLFVAIVASAIGAARFGVLELHDRGAVLLLMAAGGVVQVLLGCMTYLLPAVTAGGPAMVRVRNGRAERFAGARLVCTSLGLLVALIAPTGDRVPGLLMFIASLIWTAVTIASALPKPSPAAIAAAEAARVHHDQQGTA